MSSWKFYSAACASILFTTTAIAQPPEAPAKPAESNNTTITAKTMTVRNQESKAIFEGTVVMTRGSLIVRSDTMVVFFKANTPSGSVDRIGSQADGRNSEKGSDSSHPGSDTLPTMSNRSVSMIEAIGRVVIEKAEGRAQCQKAVYYEDEKKIVLTGDPVAWQKGTRVTGEKMTMYLADDRSIVEGKTRVTIESEGSAR